MVMVVAGVTSGVVTAMIMALGLLRGGTASQAVVPQPIAPAEAEASADPEGMLQAIRGLTAALDRAALTSPEQSLTALVSSASSGGSSSDLKATLQSLEEALERLASSPLGMH